MRTIADMTRFAFQILLELAGSVVSVLCILVCTYLLLLPILIPMVLAALLGRTIYCLGWGC